jgi:anti-sigma B factor antagonist
MRAEILTRTELPMNIEILPEDDIVIVKLSGAIELKVSGYDFFVEMEKLFSHNGTHPVLVDLSDVDYIDSNGIGELVGYMHRLEQKGCRLALLNPSGIALKLIQISNLDRVFTIYDDKKYALKELAGV